MGLRTVLRRATAARPERKPVRDESRALLASLPGEWMVLDGHGHALAASDGVEGFGMLRAGELTSADLGQLAVETLADGQSRTQDLAVGGLAFGAPSRRVRVRSARLDSGSVALLVDDISAARRVDDMRRDFISNVSDELQAPVDAMFGLAGRMQGAIGDGAELAELASRMESEANQLSALVSDLTDLSRLQAVDALDHARGAMVRDLVDEAVDAVSANAAAHHIMVSRDVPEIHFIANPEQVVTALRNLLTNAIMYSSSGSAVAVSARTSDGFVEISVADHGIGIPAGQLDRIFERFHRVDAERSRNTGGTGLGLAIVQQICLAHGGTVVAASELGKGSLFTMRFPARGHSRESSASEWKEVP